MHGWDVFPFAIYWYLLVLSHTGEQCSGCSESPPEPVLYFRVVTTKCIFTQVASESSPLTYNNVNNFSQSSCVFPVRVHAPVHRCGCRDVETFRHFGETRSPPQLFATIDVRMIKQPCLPRLLLLMFHPPRGQLRAVCGTCSYGTFSSGIVAQGQCCHHVRICMCNTATCHHSFSRSFCETFILQGLGKQQVPGGK